MKQRPIIMSAESVQAILDGRKTQTRRVVRPQPKLYTSCKVGTYTDTTGNKNKIGKCFWCDKDSKNIEKELFKNPYGQIGDRLWVKESYTFANFGKITIYRSDKKDQFGNDWQDTASQTNSWKSPLFMPRSASRLTLEITNIRVERLQDITEDDAIAEGVDINSFILSEEYEGNPYTSIYQELWDKLNAKRGYSWDSNPFVWVIEFRRDNIAVDAWFDAQMPENLRGAA